MHLCPRLTYVCKTSSTKKQSQKKLFDIFQFHRLSKAMTKKIFQVFQLQSILNNPKKILSECNTFSILKIE